MGRAAMNDLTIRQWRNDAAYDARTRDGLNPDNAFTRIVTLCDALLAANERNRRLQEATRGFWQAYADGTLYEESANEVCETFMAMLAEADQ